LNTFKKTFLLFVRHSLLTSASARTRCSLAVLLILVDVAVASLVPYCAKFIVDTLSTNILNTVWMAILLLGVFWILEKTLNHIQEIIFFPVINTTIRNLNYKVVHHIHQISLPHYQKLSMPEVINCARRISFSARAFIKIVFLMIIPTAFKLMIATLVSIKIGLFGFGLLPITLLALFILYKGTQWYVAARESAWQVTDQVTMRINDSILNTKLVRPFEQYEMEAVGKLLDTEAHLWQTTNTRLHTIYVCIGILLGITMTGILAAAVLGIQKGALTVGDFVLLKGQLIAAFLPLRNFSTEFRQLAESMVDIKKMIQIFDTPLETPPAFSARTPRNTQEPAQGIFLKNIFFSHEMHPLLLKNLSLQIPFGEKVALIGESGSGKSALINLMAGLYKPAQGTIDLGGQTLHCIPQDFRLFNMSLRENITYGLSNISEDALLNSIEQIGLRDLIHQMPKGLDTLVGEMGINLSGGEKQKVALARALLLKPDILLLDETTSSLTIESEKLVLNVLFSAIPTVILASHRTSMLQHMDRVIKIQHGKLRNFQHNAHLQTILAVY